MMLSNRAYDFENESNNLSQTAKILHIKNERLKRENAKNKKKCRWISNCCSFLIVVLFAGALGSVVYQNSIINETKYEIFNIKAEINSLNAKKEEMTARIEAKTQLKNIEYLAMTQLNLQYPKPEQIVYIDLTHRYALNEPPASNDTVVAVAENKNNNTFIEFMATLFNH